MLVWQPVQATRPALSVVSKISLWMLANVGSRFGVGPAIDDSFSSQAVRAAVAASSTVRHNTRLCIGFLAAKKRSGMAEQAGCQPP